MKESIEEILNYIYKYYWNFEDMCLKGVCIVEIGGTEYAEFYSEAIGGVDVEDLLKEWNLEYFIVGPGGYYGTTFHLVNYYEIVEKLKGYVKGVS